MYIFSSGTTNKISLVFDNYPIFTHCSGFFQKATTFKSKIDLITAVMIASGHILDKDVIPLNARDERKRLKIGANMKM